MALDTILALLDAIVSLACFVLDITTIAVTVASAVRTFVVPRAQNAYLTRLVFINVNRLFNLHMKWRKINTYIYGARPCAVLARLCRMAGELR